MSRIKVLVVVVVTIGLERELPGLSEKIFM